MKHSVLILAIIISMSACRQDSTSVEAKVSNVIPKYVADSFICSNRGDFPGVMFSILIRNREDAPLSVYVKHYGRDSKSRSGSFWVYYNGERDSLELFSASCKNCFDSLAVPPRDSIDLTLQIEYKDFIQRCDKADCQTWVDNEISEIVNTWASIKYFDYLGGQIFYASKTK